jgi:hypothetical protein
LKRIASLFIITSTILFVHLPKLNSQTAPGVSADANQPSGAPDPQKLDQIWNVDPINDQVSITIPFFTTPQGGEGPRFRFPFFTIRPRPSLYKPMAPWLWVPARRL